MALVDEFSQKELMALADEDSKILADVIREMCKTSKSTYSDKDICSSFVTSMLSANKKKAVLSKDAILEQTGLNSYDAFKDLKMEDSVYRGSQPRTRSEKALLVIKDNQVTKLTNSASECGQFKMVDWNTYVLRNLYENKDYNGYTYTDDKKSIPSLCSLYTLTPNVIKYDGKAGTDLLRGYIKSNGAISTGVDLLCDGNYYCYNMTLRQVFCAVMYCFIKEFGIGAYLYDIVHGNKVESICEVFEVRDSKFTGLIPLWTHPKRKSNQFLYVNKNFKLSSISKQLKWIKAFKDSLNIALARNKTFEPITDERFEDFCNRITFYSAFDKVSQGDCNDAKDLEHIVHFS